LTEVTEATYADQLHLDLTDYLISDSGCTHTCTSHSEFLETIQQSKPNISLVMADGHREPVSGKGTIASIGDVLLVQKLQVDLLSISQLDNSGYTTTYSQGRCIISKNGISISTGVLFNKHYVHHKRDFNPNWVDKNPQTGINNLLQQSDSHTQVPVPSSKSITLYDRIMLAHKRLGHLSYSKMLESLRHNIIIGIGITLQELQGHGPFICHSCILAKMKRLPRESSTSQLDLSSISPGTSNPDFLQLSLGNP